MLSDVIQRVRYFNEQFLTETDFRQEQAYHLDRQYRPLRELNTPGVVRGLGVTKNADGTAGVAAGVAIDHHGRQIVLLEDQSLPWPTTTAGHLLLISYHEQKTEPQGDADTVDRETRWTEAPQLSIQLETAQVPEDAVRLARLRDGQVETDSEARQLAGAKVASLLLRQEEDEQLSPRLTTGAPGELDLRGDLKVQGQLKVARRVNDVDFSSLTVSDEGNVGIGTSSPAHQLEVNGSVCVKVQGGLKVTRRVDGVDSPCLMVSDEGNVGIGTSSPAHRLEVNGSVCVKVQGGLKVTRRVDDVESPCLMVSDDGNVGIGTSSPTHKLEVNGGVCGSEGDVLRIQTNGGYVDVGPKNETWCHFRTDRDKFYFNKEIRVNSGCIGSFEDDLFLRTNGTTRLTIRQSDGGVEIPGGISVGETIKVGNTEVTERDLAVLKKLALGELEVDLLNKSYGEYLYVGVYTHRDDDKRRYAFSWIGGDRVVSDNKGRWQLKFPNVSDESVLTRDRKEKS